MAVRRNELSAPAERFRSGPGALALWWGLFGGAVGFAADEVLSYALVPHSCSTGYHWLLHFYTLMGFALAASGFWCAIWSYRQLPGSEHPDGVTVASRARWMAIYGMASSVAFAVVIIAIAIPKWALSPCDQ
jgi:hypothetical protein